MMNFDCHRHCGIIKVIKSINNNINCNQYEKIVDEIVYADSVKLLCCVEGSTCLLAAVADGNLHEYVA